MNSSAAPPVAGPAAANPYVQPPGTPIAAPYSASPGLAFLLGWIPGVGAIYNGQYLKGLMHAVIFGLLMTAANGSEGPGGPAPLLIMMIVGFVFYMPFEAYHTAKKKQLGLPVDEFSSLLGRHTNAYSSRFPVGPVVLILVGVIFLLDSLHVIEFRDIQRFWPVLLIAVGAYMLYTRLTGPSLPPPAGPAVPPVNDMMEAQRER